MARCHKITPFSQAAGPRTLEASRRRVIFHVSLAGQLFSPIKTWT
jgi:hypothetical protein